MGQPLWKTICLFLIKLHIYGRWHEDCVLIVVASHRSTGAMGVQRHVYTHAHKCNGEPLWDDAGLICGTCERLRLGSPGAGSGAPASCPFLCNFL